MHVPRNTWLHVLMNAENCKCIMCFLDLRGRFSALQSFHGKAALVFACILVKDGILTDSNNKIVAMMRIAQLLKSFGAENVVAEIWSNRTQVVKRGGRGPDVTTIMFDMMVNLMGSNIKNQMMIYK